MFSSLAFSLVLLTPGHVEYGASFTDLKDCEAEVQRIRPQLRGSNINVMCMPVNTVSQQNMDQHLNDMLVMLRRMRDNMEQDMSQTEK